MQDIKKTVSLPHFWFLHDHTGNCMYYRLLEVTIFTRGYYSLLQVTNLTNFTTATTIASVKTVSSDNTGYTRSIVTIVTCVVNIITTFITVTNA